MSDLPDYQIPMCISAITIASLPIDIVAQTIGNISVNIAASTATIDINIATGAVELYGGGNVVNPAFFMGLTGWSTRLDAVADDTIWTSAPYALRLGPTPTSQAYQEGIRPPISTNIIASITVKYRADSPAYLCGVSLLYTDGTSTSTSFFTAAANTWYEGAVNFVAGKFIRKVTLLNSTIVPGQAWFDDFTITRLADQTVGTLPNVNLNIDIKAQTASLYCYVETDTGIMLAVDIQAQTVGNINVNIAASAITLNVNIAASAITLNVNIAASAITLNVNISSQSANVNIDIEAQSISVKLVPDWGAINATDVDVEGAASVPSGIFTTLISYTVPTGKTLLIYDWSITMYTATGEIAGIIYSNTTGVTVGWGGGARGFQTPFSKPKRFTEGQVVLVRGIQDTGTTQSMAGHFGGTLI